MVEKGLSKRRSNEAREGLGTGSSHRSRCRLGRRINGAKDLVNASGKVVMRSVDNATSFFLAFKGIIESAKVG
jgi:hypothetical protein